MLTRLGANGRILPSDRVEVAAWIAPRLHGFGERVDSVVPAGFEAYARLFHPAGGPWGKRARWADVAAWSGRVMHAHADFELLAQPIVGYGKGAIPGDEPRTGDLEPDLVVALAHVLSRHTRTPDRCWFCLWEGWGWISGQTAPNIRVDVGLEERVAALSEWSALQTPAFTREALDGPRVRLPGRDYLLLAGPVHAASKIGHWTHSPEVSRFHAQSPNLWWPDDRTWCVATEIDFTSTYIGGAAPLIEELRAAPELEVASVRPDDALRDVINGPT